MYIGQSQRCSRMIERKETDPKEKQQGNENGFVVGSPRILQKPADTGWKERFVQGAGQMLGGGGGVHNRITNDFTSGDPQGRHIDTIAGRYAAGNASRINREHSDHPASFRSTRSNANDEDERRSWRSGGYV